MHLKNKNASEQRVYLFVYYYCLFVCFMIYLVRGNCVLDRATAVVVAAPNLKTAKRSCTIIHDTQLAQKWGFSKSISEPVFSPMLTKFRIYIAYYLKNQVHFTPYQNSYQIKSYGLQKNGIFEHLSHSPPSPPSSNASRDCDYSKTNGQNRFKFDTRLPYTIPYNCFWIYFEIPNFDHFMEI